MCSHSCVTAKPNDGKPTAVTDFAEMTLTGNRGAVTKVDKSR